MKRLIFILLFLTLSSKAPGQSTEIEANRATYDTICAIHERMKAQVVLHRDSSLHARLAKLIKPAKEWARIYGSEEQQAQCAIIHWHHLSWTRSPDTYSLIIVGREVWNYRDHIPPDKLLPILGRLSSFYQRTKRPEDRLAVMLEICALQSEIDSTQHCAELSGIYHDLKQFGRAIELYHQDVVHKKKTGNWFGVSSLYNNIGLAYRDMGKRDSAEHYFRRSLGLLADEALMKDVDPWYHGHFSSVVKWNVEHLLVKELTAEKLQLAKSLIRTGSRVPEYFWVLKGYDLLARYNYNNRDFGNAELYVDSALTLANKTKHVDQLVRLLRLKGKILLATGKLEAADHLFERSNNVADSVRVAEAALDATIAAAQFEAREREQELKVSQEKTKVAELEAQREHRQRSWFKALFIAALIVLVLVAFLLRVSARSRKVITEQKQLLEASLSDKEVLLKEIHHRVKNNLQVISSLLDLQSNRLTDEVSQSAFQEGQSRVKSIALIHQQLYQTEELTGVEITMFIQALFKQIRSVMMQKGQKVELELKADRTVLDIDTAVPLGLILNEMLTNSFKHGFKERTDCTVSMSLKGVGEGKYELSYADGGPGIPENMDIKTVRSLGLRLIYRLTKQLGGLVKINPTDGSLFIIQFLDADARKEQL